MGIKMRIIINQNERIEDKNKVNIKVNVGWT